jgi:hypothetical protein
MTRGKKTVESDEYALMVKAGLDTIPSIRRVVINALRDREAFTPTDEVANALRWQSANARRVLEDLWTLGLVDRAELPSTSKGRKPFGWKLSTLARRAISPPNQPRNKNPRLAGGTRRKRRSTRH